jgi:hypothetical protein
MTSITAVLLPFMACLLTLLRIYTINHSIEESESASNKRYAAT